MATASDVDGLPGNLAEGVYVAGTGSTGAMPAMATLAGCYSAAMLAGAWGNRVPREGWAPEGCEVSRHALDIQPSSKKVKPPTLQNEDSLLFLPEPPYR